MTTVPVKRKESVKTREFSLFTLFLQYTDHHLAESLQYLQALERRLSCAYSKARVIVDTDHPHGSWYRSCEHDILGSDNSLREFTGWQTALLKLQETCKIQNDDVVLVANDSFFRNYDPKWLQYFKPKHARLASRNRVLIGWMNHFPAPMSITDHTCHAWIRTNCFLINAFALQEVGFEPPKVSPDDVFSHQVPTFFRTDAPLGKKYRAYLRTWLFNETYEDLEFSGSWYRCAPLNTKNREFFEGKAFAIICEHLFSARLASLGVRLIGINKKSAIRRYVCKLMSRLRQSYVWRNYSRKNERRNVTV